MNKDSVYLYWNNKENNESYKVAELYKLDNKFYFRYILDNVKTAIKVGFKLLIPFPNVNATYENDKLFASFASRLPDKKRPEIEQILKTYGMEKYNEYELLKVSGAKLPTDSFEFRRV